MIVGFDGKRAVQNNTGLGNYSRYILDILCERYPDVTFVLFAPKRRKNNRLEIILKKYDNIKQSYPKGLWRLFPSLWRIWGIKKCLDKYGDDFVFHGHSNELPLNISKGKKVRSVVTIHDLIFIVFPEYYKPVDRFIYRYKFRKACINADKVIAVSECTKKDIVKYFGINENKIDVVYQSCSSIFAQKESDEKKQKVKKLYNLPEKYILFVGSVEERKNLLVVVKSLKYLSLDIHLVAVGRHTPYEDVVIKYIKENNLESRVHFVHGVEFADLPSVYQLSSVFVYPSRYEGFGIPVQEALLSGVPVIAAKGSCLEEAGGPDTLYIDPDDYRTLSEYINRIMSDNVFAGKMVESGLLYMKNFSCEKQAGQIMKIYKELV